ncbi:MAG TPA: flagellar biosynthetic protein FliO [Armatimonadota bacterium]|nr:flagellar biosynthetic protein FliO [Armatimonadota bacterium]
MQRYFLIVIITLIMGLGVSTQAQETHRDTDRDVSVIDQRDSAQDGNDKTVSPAADTAPTTRATGANQTVNTPPAAPVVVPKTIQKPIKNVNQLPESKIPIDLSASDKQETKANGITFWQIINGIFRLVLVLSIAYIAMLLLKKYANGELLFARQAGGSAAQQHPKRLIRVIESVSLGQGRSISLICVGKQHLLVGVCGQQMTLLKDVTGESGIAEFINMTDNSSQGGATFLNTLSRLMPGQLATFNQSSPTTDTQQGAPTSTNRTQPRQYR